ncbi:histone-lysine N-methyltransferase EZA1-like [Pistacia vera]|uniref:histone-lysine N-methyltransferase EZA1-like n=1 Tax=Pistacia vera TaxID=55513 RepID=UPI001262B91C|nr:histone-lysine N-methyltransferase EZA1-like [Pistacia vera]
MVSKASDSSSKLRKSHAEQSGDGLGNLSYKLNQLKRQIQAERVDSIKEKLEKNRRKIESDVSHLFSATSRNNIIFTQENGFGNMPLCKYSGFTQGLGDKEYANCHEVVFSTSTKLPYMEKIPPYTTWIFLDKNQRMAEDQSVVGRRRIYYDQHGSEALICSDSEEDNVEPEEEKHEFTDAEDRIIWMAFQEHGLGEEVVNLVGQFTGVATSEIQERYNILKEKYNDKNLKDSADSGYEMGISLDKTLSAALDSFDNLFCRRCLLFDCRLHGCSQTLIDPCEKQSYWSEYEDDRKPCSDHCYLQLRTVQDVLEGSTIDVSDRMKDTKEGTAVLPDAEEPGTDNDTDLILDGRSNSEKVSSVTSEAVHSSVVAIRALTTDTYAMQSLGKRKALQPTNVVLNELIQVSDDLQNSSSKKQKKLLPLDVITASSDAIASMDADSGCHIGASSEGDLQMITKDSQSESIECVSEKFASSSNALHDKIELNIRGEAKDVKNEPELKQASSKVEVSEGVFSSSEWKPIEKELYLKGVEIFGRNSCLIARNLLSGLKTCIEVSSYMREGGSSMPHKSVAASSFLEENRKADSDCTEQEMPTRPRLLRRRGRTRKLKYSWKSAGHPSIWKRIADGKNQSCKQYTPCGCQSMCGKQCPCLHNGTCCEKYCGCSKSCKNRFRGCHCAKSQCRSRQCPCFAAGRECDPDVCRNCWVSCGDGSLGEPLKRGDGQCGNMRLLLRQQQRILLAKSDVAGWGAFLKNSVNKNDYLGEYTGELISHREADKRGKIYDRANSSFLFDLNDQFVLDAYRKGDKLKFANHSSNPNCYAKVMLVAGDHRVGIFAKEHIEASEELFYDYRYGPDQAPVWARKPEGSKRDDSSVSQGRAKKHQSH